MNIEKAIQELSESLDESIPTLRETRYDALKLGIEALRFIQLSRVATPGSVPTLLHGETAQADSP